MSFAIHLIVRVPDAFAKTHRGKEYIAAKRYGSHHKKDLFM